MLDDSRGKGQAGDNAGILLRGIKREEISRGQDLACPTDPPVLAALFRSRCGVGWYRAGAVRHAQALTRTGSRGCAGPVQAGLPEACQKVHRRDLRPHQGTKLRSAEAHCHALLSGLTGTGTPLEEGGRHTPFFKNYRPQFFIRTADVTGTVTLPKDVEMAMPGDNISVEVRALGRYCDVT
eukprot:904047-Rhodomonas_salina.3